MKRSAYDTEMKQPQLQQQQQSSRQKPKGGLITMPFIIANEALEKMASVGLLANMILYLTGSYHVSVAKGTNLIFYWNAVTNFMPLIGAFLADSYLGRFLTIALGCIFTLLGNILLWLTAMFPKARPPPCSNPYTDICKSPNAGQYAFLISAFALMSIGAGGIRASSMAFGANQLEKIDKPRNENNRVLEKFFSWYYALAAIGIFVGFVGIVRIQDYKGWKMGFGVPVILMFSSMLAFFLASPFYIKEKPTRSYFTSFAQVIVVAYKNRKLRFPGEDSNGGYHNKDSRFSKPTNKLRFLNKACIFKNPQDITPEGEASNPWRLCTVEQVEELKSLIRVLPLWSTSIVSSISINQGTFLLLQARSMNRNLTSNFKLSAGSFQVFSIIGAIIWIVAYDRLLLPLASKIREKPVKVGIKIRLGLGLFGIFLAMVVSAIVEHIRRREALKSGFSNNPFGVVAMSAFWLVPQLLLLGMGEACNVVAQNEFFYCELPKSLSSIATALSGLALAVGNLLASFVVSRVNHITRRGRKESWLANDINKGHYESYYWLLAIMSGVNLIYFLLCSWAYGACSDDGMFGDERKDLGAQELVELGNEVRVEGQGSKGKV